MKTKILSTKNYSMFGFILGNRNVVSSNVSKMVRLGSSFRLDTHPIIVNRAMEVIDGQHRLAAATMLGVTVYYVIDYDAPTSEEDREGAIASIIVSNQVGKIHTVRDRLEMHLNLNHPEVTKVYSVFNRFEGKFDIITVLKILSGSFQIEGAVQSGKFDLRNLTKGFELLTALHESDLCPKLKYKQKVVRGLFDVMQRYKVDGIKLIEAASRRRGDFGQPASVGEVRKALVGCYNYGKAVDKRIGKKEDW